MKQGNLLNRALMLILFGAIMLYLGISAWRSFTDKMITMTCYTYTMDDQQEATGFLIRSEYVLPEQSALADVLPAEGEKVGVGQTVAYLYQDAAALERRQQIRALNLQLEQLNYSLSKSDDHSDNAKLTAEIMTRIAKLRAGSASRDFTSLEEDTMELKSLVYKRDSAYGAQADAAAAQAEKDALTTQIQGLTNQARQDTSAVVADRSGVFSGMVDGYENVLTPAQLDTLTPAALDALARQEPQTQSGAVGKLITSSRWYFVCTLGEDQTGRLADLRDSGRTAAVRFSRDWAGEVAMKVERIGAPENGRVAVVFSSTQHLSDTTLLRRQTVDIVYSSTTGIRLPKNALYQNEQGIWGAYVVVGAKAEFKPVTIVGDGEDYYLVRPIESQAGDTDGAKKALRSGDVVILSADGLYDGKVVKRE